MSFNTADVYTTSGDIKLFNTWPDVDKFTTSAFYNWEQDNIPITDLEQRSYELWEKQGFPTSSIPGMAYVVSSAQGIEDPNIVSANIFTDLESAIDALPNNIRFPIIRS